MKMIKNRWLTARGVYYLLQDHSWQTRMRHVLLVVFGFPRRGFGLREDA